MNDRELYAMAKKAASGAYAPYSGFMVGAALLLDDGEVFTGANVENSSYGAAICAERVAFVKAVTGGYLSFKKIAVASANGAAWPCGICRQFMFEFGEGLIVITGDDEDHLESHTLGELLLKGFKL